jgi:carbonic anhydrase
MRARFLVAFIVLAALMLPAWAIAAWQPIASEPGKRIEIDRASIKKSEGGQAVVLGRIVLDKPIKDTKTAETYRIIEALHRFNCDARSYSTIKRKYFKDEENLLREEIVRTPLVVPVRTGTFDDKLLREVCRPESNTEAAARVSAPAPAPAPASKTIEKVNALTGELHKANEALIQKAVKRVNTSPPAASHPLPQQAKTAVPPPKPRPPAPLHSHWSYEGDGGPENWGKIKADYATCANGKRQSPIDIRDGIRVDLEAIQFAYQPSPFRVLDNGHTVQVTVGGSSIRLLGKAYELIQFHFHHPSEERVNGKAFDMVVHLVHKSEDNKLAVVAILLKQGKNHPLVQTIWNNLPLEKNDEVTPPSGIVDVAQLLPEDRSYYTYMGSLTTPPCAEGVLWLVLKEPQQISSEQLAIFGRLYKNNARPVQPSFDRLIKESH